MEGNRRNLAYAEMEIKNIEQETDWTKQAAPVMEPAVPITVPKRGAYPIVKRFFDVVLSALALVVLSPLFLIVAIVIKAEDGGPVFYRHRRVGKDGREIGVYKFRTMRVNADRLEDMLTPEQLAEYRREFKLENDPRITKVGNFLRKTSIDELPQLLNILCGQMSVVGPRPLVRDELEEKYSPVARRTLLSVRPGLTGLWQVSGRSECTYESGERQKLELSYVRKMSLWIDVGILFKTVTVVLSGIGAK